MKPTEKQIGGTHYKSGYQPLELATKLNLNPFQLKIIKYITRYKNKGGLEDLQKAIHVAELAIHLKPLNFSKIVQKELRQIEIREYFKSNTVPAICTLPLIAVIYGDYELCIMGINSIIKQEYE